MTDTAPTPEPAPAPEAPKPGEPSTDIPAGEPVDWKAKYEDLLAPARKHEQQAKQNREDAEAWRKYQESQKTEDEKRAAREKELEERAIAAETKALRADVADDKKVPAQWRKFLTGSSKEDLEASADEILALIANNPGATPDPNQGTPTSPPAGDFLRNSVRR